MLLNIVTGMWLNRSPCKGQMRQVCRLLAGEVERIESAGIASPAFIFVVADPEA